MESENPADAPCQDYPDRSVWTTWAISYNAIREKNETSANLLLFWAFFDNKNLWHDLFAAAYNASTFVTKRLSKLIGNIASNQFEFTKAIQLLRNYSL